MSTDETTEVTGDETPEVAPPDQTVRVDLGWVMAALLGTAGEQAASPELPREPA